MRFRGKTILITGASEGIGRALALSLARERPRLALAARNAGRLESVAAECRALGAEAASMPTDVTDRAACEALLSDGWRVATIWECALRKPEAVEQSAAAIEEWLLSETRQLEIGETDPV